MESFDGNDGVVEVTSGREVEGLLGWILGQLGGHWVGGASSRIRPQASCEKFPSGGKKSFLGQFWVKCVCVGGGAGSTFSFWGWFWCFFFQRWRWAGCGGSRLGWLSSVVSNNPTLFPSKKPTKNPQTTKNPLNFLGLGGILGFSTAGFCSKKSLFPFFGRGSENILYSLIFPQQKDFIISLPLH